MLSMQTTDLQVIWGLLSGEKEPNKQAFLYSLVGKKAASLPKWVLQDSLNNRGGARLLLQVGKWVGGAKIFCDWIS